MLRFENITQLIPALYRISKIFLLQPVARRIGGMQAGRIAMTRRRHGRAERRDCAEQAQEVVARVWNVPVSELRSPTRRSASVAQARQVAMYLTHVIYGVSLASVGHHFGRDRTTAAHACRQIEDRRDDAGFDRLLDEISDSLRDAGAGARPQ
jgi:chromosomal replication initiation ATPase DnaA